MLRAADLGCPGPYGMVQAGMIRRNLDRARLELHLSWVASSGRCRTVPTGSVWVGMPVFLESFARAGSRIACVNPAQKSAPNSAHSTRAKDFNFHQINQFCPSPVYVLVSVDLVLAHNSKGISCL